MLEGNTIQELCLSKYREVRKNFMLAWEEGVFAVAQQYSWHDFSLACTAGLEGKMGLILSAARVGRRLILTRAWHYRGEHMEAKNAEKGVLLNILEILQVTLKQLFSVSGLGMIMIHVITPLRGIISCI